MGEANGWDEEMSPRSLELFLASQEAAAERRQGNRGLPLDEHVGAAAVPRGRRQQDVDETTLIQQLSNASTDAVFKAAEAAEEGEDILDSFGYGGKPADAGLSAQVNEQVAHSRKTRCSLLSTRRRSPCWARISWS